MQFGNPVWEEVFRQRTWGQYPSEEAVRFVKRAGAWGLSGHSALDIGAGQGACSWMMAREGLVVTAFEGAPAGLNRIPETVKSFGGGAVPDLVLGDILRPREFLGGRRFHMMLDHYSLYANPREDIREAYLQYHDLLAPGGYLLTCCFGKRSTSFGRGREVGEDSFEDIPAGGHLAGRGRTTFFDKTGLEAMLSGAGFSIRYSESICHEDPLGILEKLVTCAFRPAGS